MPFHLHDTLTGTKIPLPARTPGEASIYVCGPTVYNLIHVGNARPAVVFDVLARHLRASGLRVRFVRNFTDIDDKIIAAAVETGEAPMAIAQRYIDAYLEDTGALNCRRPDAEPRVSQYMTEIVGMIEALLARGHAYVRDGDVYFAVRTFDRYGRLSGRELGELRSGERVAVDERKDDALDFALWKAAKPQEPAGARWPSPWGEGRPGWHIECSAMARRLLGDGFDLHGGGLDLIFPHHENEIAQSECASGAPFARAWMHNGFIEVDVERGANLPDAVAELLPALRTRDPNLMKVSKSDPLRLAELRARPAESLSPEERALSLVLERKVAYGYWFQLRRLLGRVDPEALRLWILGTHYRSPLGFELAFADGAAGAPPRFPAIEEAERRVEYFYETKARLLARIGRASMTPAAAGPSGPAEMRRRFDAALDDDLNTAAALAPMSDAFRRANELCDANKKDTAEGRALLEAIDHMTEVLGVAEGDPERFFARVRARRVAERGLDAAEIDRLVAERIEARKARDFARADAIRAELLGRGIEIRDSPAGSTWRVTLGDAAARPGGDRAGS